MIFSLLYQTKRSTLGLVSLDVLMSEVLDLPSEVTQYPVEDGGPEISDHITQGNEELQINGSVSHNDVEAFEFGTCSHKLIDTIEMFRDMHKARKPITVVTGIMMYEDMGFDGVTITRNNSPDRGGNWLEINAKLRKVIKVKLEQADLPPEQNVSSGQKGKAGKTEAKGKFAGTDAKSPTDAVDNRTPLLKGIEYGTGQEFRPG